MCVCVCVCVCVISVRHKISYYPTYWQHVSVIRPSLGQHYRKFTTVCM